MTEIPNPNKDTNQANPWTEIWPAKTNHDSDTSLLPPDDGLVFATPMDALRFQLGYTDIAKRITPEEKAQHELAELHKPLQGESSDDDTAFKHMLKKIAYNLMPEGIHVAYNPGSNEHVSMAMAFPEARTIFVDPDGDVEHRFVQHNIDKPELQFEFYRADMHSFKLPDALRADMVLILNAGYMTNEELNTVTKPGSLIVVNEWHGAASFMQTQCPDYTFLTIYDSGSGSTNDLHVFQRADEPTTSPL